MSPVKCRWKSVCYRQFLRADSEYPKQYPVLNKGSSPRKPQSPEPSHQSRKSCLCISHLHRQQVLLTSHACHTWEFTYTEYSNSCKNIMLLSLRQINPGYVHQRITLIILGGSITCSASVFIIRTRYEFLHFL